MPHRIPWIALAIPVIAGCATTTTRVTPVAPEAVRAEEVTQRQLVLKELSLAQQRLDGLAFPLLAAATPFCGNKTALRMGLTFATLSDFSGVWVDAARVGLGLSDTLAVSSVAMGSPAARAGLALGDRILVINDQTLALGKAGRTAAMEALQGFGMGPQTLTIRRGDETREVEVVPTSVCDYGAIVTVEGDINAFADGDNLFFPWAMMRFANDDELRGVLGHEIAHNAMGHLAARKRNALLVGLIGAAADVAAAAGGVNTGGQNTSNFMALGASAFSQDFEREADYVGMYILARAGAPLETVPELWRQFAQINPAAIGLASTHPTTAERFVRLREIIREIEAKRAAGEELTPELKPR
jgi:beta-barrel assembly-enhancing protease